MRRRLAELPPGTYRGDDFLGDDGSSDEPVRVNLAITVSPDRLVLDFAGSSAQRPGNINAVAPMPTSAVFFAVKILADPEIPVNAGTFRSVELRIPDGSFLAARPPAAVCAGNTETTQRVADTVLKVCAQFAPDWVPAASQGTMNLIGSGGDAKHGRNAVIHVDGTVEEAPGKATLSLGPGEIVVVETPGGGGWGRGVTSFTGPIQCSEV